MEWTWPVDISHTAFRIFSGERMVCGYANAFAFQMNLACKYRAVHKIVPNGSKCGNQNNQVKRLARPQNYNEREGTLGERETGRSETNVINIKSNANWKCRWRGSGSGGSVQIQIHIEI